MVRLLTLGELRLEGGDFPPLSSRRKELVLLAYLARRGGRPVRRGELAPLLWDERDERRARQSLRQALLELRRLVGDGLSVDAEQVVLAQGGVELDATLFEREVEAGRLREAVALWRGEFLAGAEEVGGEELRTWLEAEREGLRQRLRAALSDLAADAQRRGAWSDGIGWAERWTEALPRDQEAQVRLIRLLHLAGRSSDALARCAGVVARLRADEAEPSPELAQLAALLERGGAAAPERDAGSAALFTPDLVGRGASLAELESAWTLARQGGACAVLVEGEQGIGKTRLSEEFLRRVEREEGRPPGPRARARDAGPGAELGVVARIISDLADTPGLGGAPASSLAALATLVPRIRERFPALPAAGTDTAALEEALRDAVGAVAAESPVVVFVDDLPQADPASRRLLDSLSRRLPAGVLLLATARTGEEEPAVALPSHAGVRRLKLLPLPATDVELLLESMLDLPPESRHRLALRLHEHGAGNPFYVVELVSALADEGRLAPNDRGAWRLQDEDRPLPLPSSVRDLIGRRIARLSPAGRTALEAAAVLGVPFSRELLVAVAGDSPVAAEAGLEELILHRMVRETGGPDRYEIASELVRRQVERDVPAARGETLSSRAAEALAPLAGDPVLAAGLAHHRERSAAVVAAARRRRRTRLALAGAAVAILGLGVGLRARSGPLDPSSTIAVLPFAVSGPAELEYLGEGMVTLLGTDLAGVGSIRSVDPRAVLGISAQLGSGASNLSRATRVAQRLGAGTFVIGDVVEGGGRIRIGATAYSRGDTARPLARAQVEGTTGQLFELVDGLAGQLLSELASGPYEQLTRVAARTTGSLPALRSYLEGERLFRTGAFHPAALAFQRATVEDTTFALAYYWLSVASWWADDSRAIDSAASAAVRYGGRLPERDRRLFQAWDAFLQGDAIEAERIYREIVGLEPENVEAWLQLGEVLFHSGPRRGYPIAVALPAFERVLFFEPEHTSAILHLARIAAAERRLGDLDSLVRRILALNPTGEWAVEARALRGFSTGDVAEQRAVLEELRTAVEGRVWNTARYVALTARNREGARRLVELLTAPTRPAEVRAFGYLALAHLAMAGGRAGDAEVSLDRAARLDPVATLEHRALFRLIPFLPADRGRMLALRDSLERRGAPAAVASLETSHLANLHDAVHPELAAYLSAGLSIRLGDTAAARARLTVLDRAGNRPGAGAVAADAAGSVRAQLARAGGRPAEAIRMLERVQALEARVGLIGGSPFFSQGYERFLYAGLLEEAGRLDEALRWYGAFSANSVFDLVYLAPARVRQGAILERMGRGEEAAESYRASLTLWRGCDAELRPVLGDAETGLERRASPVQ